MTETQTTNHRAPLKPGEIRTHVVGNRTFRVMHTGGGMLAQAAILYSDRATQVLHTGHEDIAVRRYADAIEAAEAELSATPTVRAEDGTPDAAAMAPCASLRKLVEAYGESIARASMEISMGRVSKAIAHAGRADALKAEIIERYAR